MGSDGDAPACTRTRTPHPTHRNLGVINRLQCNPPHRKLSGQVERDSVPYGTRGSRVASATGGGGTARARKKAGGSGRGAGVHSVPNWRHIYRDCSRELAQKPSRCLSCALGAVRVRGCTAVRGPFAKPYRTIPTRSWRGGRARGAAGHVASRAGRRAVMVDMSCLERPRKGGRLRVRYPDCCPVPRPRAAAAT